MGERSRRWRFWRRAVVALALGLAVPRGAAADPLLDQPYFIVMFGNTPMLIDKASSPESTWRDMVVRPPGHKPQWQGPRTVGSVLTAEPGFAILLILKLATADPEERAACGDSPMHVYLPHIALPEGGGGRFARPVPQRTLEPLPAEPDRLVFWEGARGVTEYYTIKATETMGYSGTPTRVRVSYTPGINPKTPFSATLYHRFDREFTAIFHTQGEDCIFIYSSSIMRRVILALQRRVTLGSRLLATPPL